LVVFDPDAVVLDPESVVFNALWLALLGGVQPTEAARGAKQAAVIVKDQITFRRFINVSPKSDEGEFVLVQPY
jgi:hypothetical protein